MCTESEDLLLKGQVMSVSSKSELLPHNPRVKVMVRNLTARTLKVPAKAVVGEVTPCNVVPPIWKPEVGVGSEDEGQNWSEEMENLFQQLGLNEPQDWMTKEDILKAKKLIQKFHMVFSKNDLDLGKTDKVKYRIKVTNPIPFKEETVTKHAKGGTHFSLLGGRWLGLLLLLHLLLWLGFHLPLPRIDASRLWVCEQKKILVPTPYKVRWVLARLLHCTLYGQGTSNK